MAVLIDNNKCLECGCCMDACRFGAMEFFEFKACINDQVCTECKSCIEMCPNRAITYIPVLNQNGMLL